MLRGTVVGEGSVLAAHTVARGTYPDYAIVGGVPGKVIKDRRVAYAQAEETRAYLAEIDAAKREGRTPQPQPPQK